MSNYRKHLYRSTGQKIFINPKTVAKFAMIGYNLDQIRKEYDLSTEIFAEYQRRNPDLLEAFQRGQSLRNQ